MDNLDYEEYDDIFKDPLNFKLWERRYIYVSQILE